MQLVRKTLVSYGQIKHRVPRPLRRVLNLMWCIGGYRGILAARLSWSQRIRLIREFIKIDLKVERGHQPREIADIVRLLAQHRPQGELFIEAGCWKGCSSCKFSRLAEIFDYRLIVYDSFAGVEVTSEDPSMDFSGMYRATFDEVRGNLDRYGIASRCTLVPGWFSETIAHGAPGSVAAAYIDCDLAKGTLEVLRGIIGRLSPDGVIFTQDYHIPVVRRILESQETWQGLGVRPPTIRYLSHNLAVLDWLNRSDCTESTTPCRSIRA